MRCSIASGLVRRRRKPIILIQNTGLMESGDSIRGWLMGMDVPVVLMVGYRGWTRHGVTTDTAATYTERFLNAFNINYYLVENDADSARITIAFEEAAQDQAAGRDPGRRRVSRLQSLRGEQAMIQHADMLKVFQPHRGDAIVISGRGGQHWIKLSERQALDIPLGRPGDGRPCRLRARPRAGAAEAEGRAVRLRGRHPDEPRHAGDDRRAEAGELLSLHARQRVLRHHRRPAGAEREERRLCRAGNGAGYPRAFNFTELDDWSRGLPGILAKPGPVFAALKVYPEVENTPIGGRAKWNPRSRDQVMADLAKELGVS